MLAIQDQPLTEPDILAEHFIIHFTFLKLVSFLSLLNDSDQGTLNNEIHFFDLTSRKLLPSNTAASLGYPVLLFYYFVIQGFVFFVEIV